MKIKFAVKRSLRLELPRNAASKERGVTYWEYTVVLALLALSALSAVPEITTQINALDQRNASLADANDAYPTPLLP